MKKIAKKFAEESGYIGAEYLQEWKGYSVFNPVYSKETATIGLPYVILVKNEKARMSTVEETFEYLDEEEK